MEKILQLKSLFLGMFNLGQADKNETGPYSSFIEMLW